MKKYSTAPLPFQGQKRRFLRQIEQMAIRQPENTLFVDLFGGSGLVSHAIKCTRPDCRAIYNDFDHYADRLAMIPQTNEMLEAMRRVLVGVPRKERITGSVREALVEEVRQWDEHGAVDWLTLSSNLLFTMNYVQNFEAFSKETLYNRLRLTPYDATGYLEGVEVVSMDYRRLFYMYRHFKNAVFILDPPYLSTDCSTYQSDAYWRLSDYLDVLKCLEGTRYVYFTSSRSSLIELAAWMGHNPMKGDPFQGATSHEIHVSGQALNYTDIMLENTD